MKTHRLDSEGLPTPAAIADENKLQEIYSGYRGVDKDYVHAGSDPLERWWDCKFGIRIHWSVYSVTGNGPESWPLTPEQGGTPLFRGQYEELARWWNPSEFSADEWTDMMVRAGIRFFTFTTKHHDGFSMYDTKTKVKKRFVHTGPDAGKIVDCDLHYSIKEGPFGRDIVGELVDAGRKRNLGIGLYFSHIDWFDADFRIDQWNYHRDVGYTRESDPEGYKRMLERHREQIRELCTNYGELDLLSLDMFFPAKELGIWDDIIETVKMARRLQPTMLMRHRGIDEYGDYCTPERSIPENMNEVTQMGGEGEHLKLDKPWKVIYPGSKHFSHVWHDEYKPASWIIEKLIDITAKGGVFQVGYGPMPNGRWPQQVVSRLEKVGDWLRVNGEAIYATRPFKVFMEGDRVRFTRSKDNKFVYAIFLDQSHSSFNLKSVGLKSVRAANGGEVKMLGADHNFTWRQDERNLEIDIPERLLEGGNAPFAFRIEVGK